MSHRARINRMTLQLDYLTHHLVPALNRAPDVLHTHAPTGRIASPSFNAGSRGTDTTSTTERHALNPDPEQRAVEHVFTTWRQMLTAIEHCVHAIDALAATATPKPLREPSLPPPCRRCDETALTLKTGMCDSPCYQRWWRARQADPNLDLEHWLIRERKQLAAEAAAATRLHA